MALCRCGCGRETALYKYTDNRTGAVAGQSAQYIHGHNRGGLPGMTQEKSGKWLGNKATDNSKRYRARRLVKRLGTCARCGTPATERHHRNRNINDNSPTNIELLCANCHDREHNPPKPCIECGSEAKPKRNGLCPRCHNRNYSRKRRALWLERVGGSQE